MALTAYNGEGEIIRASLIGEEGRRQEFTCRHCRDRLIFVDAVLKIKHFRHKSNPLCDPEPETEEHVYYKELVFNKLTALNTGRAHLEHPVGRHIADVYWERDHEPHIAFEIQASNYDISRYEDKIKCYALKKLLVVYIFCGQ